MTKRILALASLAALLAFGGEAQAFTDSATGTATAKIGTAITITQDGSGANGGNLAFGHIIPGTGGTVTITPAGASSSTGTVVLTNQITKSAAKFKVTGDIGNTYTITLPVGSVNITNTTGSVGETMAVGTFTKTTTAGALDASGQEVFNVGGTLTVASGQVAGVYQGTFPISVAYN